MRRSIRVKGRITFFYYIFLSEIYNFLNLFKENRKLSIKIFAILIKEDIYFYSRVILIFLSFTQGNISSIWETLAQIISIAGLVSEADIYVTSTAHMSTNECSIRRINVNRLFRRLLFRRFYNLSVELQHRYSQRSMYITERPIVFMYESTL